MTGPKRFERLETSSSGESSLMRSHHLASFPSHALPARGEGVDGRLSLYRLGLPGDELRIAVGRVRRHRISHAVVGSARCIVLRLQRADAGARSVVPDFGPEIDELLAR